jgi:signal transduction histidine kinase
MRRRSTASGQPAKSRRRKVTLKRRNARKPKQAPSRSASSVETKVTQLTRERDEALETQRAAAEVLKIIRASRTELQPVLEVVVMSAARYCKAEDVTLFELDGQDLRATAHWGARAVPHLEGLRFSCTRGTVAGRVILERKPVHVIDLQAEAEDFPEGSALARRFGHRTIASVPLLSEGMAVGTLQIRRTEVSPFTDKQIALLGTFADQAVIAIENARLLNELRERTSDLSESLEQQTATADVLRVISSSPGELEPVFQAILENAVRICEAKFGVLHLSEGEGFRIGAMRNAPPAYAELRRREPVMRRPNPRTAIGRAAATKQTVQIADVQAEPGYFDPLPGFGGTQMPALTGARTIVAVPMLKDDSLIGVIIIYRQEIRPFTDKQIALVQNFAAQAVIAIENVRLFDEVQARTRELQAALDYQTATSDVLEVISRTPIDLQPVLTAICETVAKLCETRDAEIFIRDGDRLRLGWVRGSMGTETETWPIRRGLVMGRAVLNGELIQVHDLRAASEEYSEGYQSSLLIGHRTIIAVPLMRKGEAIGVLTLRRSEVKPFTDKQINLLRTFADQAVIAIENVRLFDEIQDKSRQLEIASQHKSQFLANMSHELRTPLNAILGYTELMADGAYGQPSEKMLGILKRLEANGRHLLGLINDVLDLSKIEAGQLVLELSDYSLQDIAQTVRSTLEPLAADKKLAFKVEMARELPAGRGDGRRLTQVLINLVGNAIKFTDAGEVAIKAEADNGAFHVSVCDTGPGISAADQAKLFQEFQQADNAITRKKGGTGLGLAISKRIIEMHGGKIRIESQPGQGSTFAFTLPVVVEQQINLESK